MIRITLPLPDAILSPNSRGHWGAKYRAVRFHRQVARRAMKALKGEA